MGLKNDAKIVIFGLKMQEIGPKNSNLPQKTPISAKFGHISRRAPRVWGSCLRHGRERVLRRSRNRFSLTVGVYDGVAAQELLAEHFLMGMTESLLERAAQPLFIFG